MSSATQKNDLTLHLSELLKSLTEFYDILNAEAKCLLSADSALLYDISKQKEQQSNDITLLIQQLESTFQLPSNLLELQNSAELKSQPYSTQNLVEKILTLSESCKNMNVRNGITIQALFNINAQMIELLSGNESPSVSLYNATGSKKHSGTKSSLGKA